MNTSYEPPYESPIEDILAWNIIKYLSDSTVLTKQVEFQTICGNFRVDFVAQNGRRRVGLECDGKDYHNEGRDEWRDAILVGSRLLDAIYHFPGKGIYYHIEGCLAALLVWEPQLFSERGRINLGLLARPVVEQEGYQQESIMFIAYPENAEERDWEEEEGNRRKGIPQGFNVRRTSNNAHSIFWREIYEFAVTMGGGNLDMIITKWREAE
jgi:very-short-patch-repair endonuclease